MILFINYFIQRCAEIFYDAYECKTKLVKNVLCMLVYCKEYSVLQIVDILIRK